MVGEAENIQNPWINTLEQPSRLVDVDNGSLISEGIVHSEGFEASHSQSSQSHQSVRRSDAQWSFHEQAFSGAGSTILAIEGTRIAGASRIIGVDFNSIGSEAGWTVAMNAHNNLPEGFTGTPPKDFLGKLRQAMRNANTKT